ncbi:MAG: SRPBCC family protein [Vicinamibacteria bacterium]
MCSDLYIDRPPRDVWRLLTDLRRWKEWSPLCTNCRPAGGGDLEVGTDLLMRLDFRLVAVEVRTRITRLVPCRRIQWEAEALGASFVHGYGLRPVDGGTLLSNRELITGLRAPVRFLVQRWFRATNLSLASLEGIKRLTEARP